MIHASSSTAADSTTSGSCDYPHDSLTYDVFINHRGEDTKKTFASYLYRRLLSEGFTAFLDQQELQEGFDFPSQIAETIRTALVHVAVFSPKYAESRWCLEELQLMRKSGTPIIPIFYHVDPSELRRAQNKCGAYGEALHILQMKETEDPQTGMAVPRYDSVTIQNWSNALSSLADISGFDLDGKFKGDEGEMLEKVIQRVVEILSVKKRTRLYVAKYPTGLADKVNDFEKVSRKHHTGKVQMVGIVGLGGVGKTTLALEFFNRKRSEYNKTHFLSGVRENAKSPVQLLQLQRELLKGLSESDRHIDNIHQGTQMLKEFLSSSKFLVILDDVDHERQVDNFLPDRDVYSSNSLILITSRDRDVLRRSGVEEISIYKLTGLPLKHSRQLFCSYAFCQAYPLKGFEHLVNEFLSACQGLPLSLKVFGALLFGKNDKTLWEDTLSQIHEVPDDIQKTLRISYDGLQEKDQQIFLDIACFFIGEKRDITVGIWDEPGRKGSSRFQNLESKCLVEVDSDNYIRMHDHIRDLGRDIAQGKLPRRLWHPTENIDTLLQQSSGSTEVRSIRMFTKSDSNSYGYRSDVTLSWRKSCEELFRDCLVKLCITLNNTCYPFTGIGVEKLQLLDTEGHLLEGILKRVHSPHLIWLSWRECPYYSLPSWIPTQNLRVLKVKGKLLKTLWQGRTQPPLQLRELQIFGNISKIPKSIGQLKHLERIFFCDGLFQKLPEEFSDMRLLKVLVLKDCSKLKALPESFGNLSSLQHLELSSSSSSPRRLDMSSFSRLKKLPESFGNLLSLQHLKLSSCCSLEKLPESFGNLPSLQHMELSQSKFWDSGLRALPESFGNLRSLQQLELSDCPNLEGLPESFGNLRSLQHLELSDCPNLETLSESFGNLRSLQHLEISDCLILEGLPESFGNLRSLQHMKLHECWKLETLSESFGILGSLQHFELYNCPISEGLPESFGNLPSLQHLELCYCKLERLPESFGNLPSLRHLQLCHSRLENLPESFGNLPSLQHMELSYNRFQWQTLRALPESFGNLRSLQHLELSDCPILEGLPEFFGNLPSLEHLELSHCRLERLPESFGNFPSLQHMGMSHCKFERLPESFGNLLCLQHMELSRCEILIRLPESFGNLPSLQHLVLSSCWRLEKLPESFGNLPSLQQLELSRCEILKTLPESFGKLRSLQHLELSSCCGLEKLPESFGNLPSLQHLELSGCEVLKRLPESLGNLRSLQHFELCHCPILEELPESCGNLPSLQYLELSCCEILKTLPESFGNLQSLQHLELSSCWRLETLPESFGNLASLQKIKLSDCQGLRTLPESFGNLPSLQYMKLSSCSSLERLPDSFGNLRSLLRVKLLYCQSLERLPESFGNLTNLQRLVVIRCENLRKLPESFGNLQNLQQSVSVYPS